jgi:2-hydroxy-3-keto-5-methylthiopentenyl-1-phosphate phosphatase
MSTKSPFNKASPIHWILDWDGTITKKDTLDALVNISAATKPDFPTRDHWNNVSKAYMDDYTDTLSRLAPNGNLPTTISGEKHLLAQMKAVEQRSLDRVSSCGIFAGLTKQAINAGAEQAITSRAVELRNGFPEFFGNIRHHHKDNGLMLLSVNWSRTFIQSCLRAADMVHVPICTIISNELDGIEAGEPSTGTIVSVDDPSEGLIMSSGDKIERMKRMQLQGQKVYVGDSWTDIECLLAADLGICIRDDPIGSSQKKLAEALTRLGVSCPRLRDYKDADEWSVVWARDFAEIQDWIASRSS